MIGKKSESIAPEINLLPLQGKNIELSFNGDSISSDGGLLLLGELDSQLNLLSQQVAAYMMNGTNVKLVIQLKNC